MGLEKEDAIVCCSAYSVDLSAFLFPDDDAAPRDFALIGYHLDFINGHETSSCVAADSSVLLGRGNAVTMESVAPCICIGAIFHNRPHDRPVESQTLHKD
jgi:hypothetical protein